MADVKNATITELAPPRSRSRARTWIVPLVAGAAVVLLGSSFLQHFPATLLAFAFAFAFALVLLAVGRLAPITREAFGFKQADLLRSGIDFAGLGLLASAATQGASGEIQRAFAALLHG